jgi:hypothetical protein
MKEKIVALVVLMLVATTVASATNTINLNTKTQPKSCSVDVPVWKVGDSWTYKLHGYTYTYSSNGSLYSTYLMNSTETLTVTSVSSDNYTLQVTNTNISGKFFYGPYKFIFTKFMKNTVTDYLLKTNLGEVSYKNIFKGLIIWLIGKLNFPLPAQLSVSSLTHNNQPDIVMPFPLVAGTNGTIPNFHSVWSQKCTLYWGLMTVYNMSGQGDMGIRPYTVKMENITVPAGTYNAYNVTVRSGPFDKWRSYYVPELGYCAKQYVYLKWGSTTKPYESYEIDLISTTYTP